MDRLSAVVLAIAFIGTLCLLVYMRAARKQPSRRARLTVIALALVILVVYIVGIAQIVT